MPVVQVCADYSVGGQLEFFRFRLLPGPRWPNSPPLRLRNMKDTSNRNEHNREEQTGEDAPEVSYTSEQRRLILKGLRIWARVAIRSYMRKHGAGSLIEDGGEEED